mgnify:CR=1 FL=1
MDSLLFSFSEKVIPVRFPYRGRSYISVLLPCTASLGKVYVCSCTYTVGTILPYIPGQVPAGWGNRLYNPGQDPAIVPVGWGNRLYNPGQVPAIVPAQRGSKLYNPGQVPVIVPVEPGSKLYKPGQVPAIVPVERGSKLYKPGQVPAIVPGRRGAFFVHPWPSPRYSFQSPGSRGAGVTIDRCINHSQYVNLSYNP